ncbi:hypothetical protein BJ546DRAFT_527160 [Cryomyces antarcticus]
MHEVKLPVRLGQTCRHGRSSRVSLLEFCSAWQTPLHETTMELKRGRDRGCTTLGLRQLEDSQQLPPSHRLLLRCWDVTTATSCMSIKYIHAHYRCPTHLVHLRRLFDVAVKREKYDSTRLATLKSRHATNHVWCRPRIATRAGPSVPVVVFLLSGRLHDDCKLPQASA